MANQKKPNSRNLTGEINPGIGDETEELDFEKILAEFGGEGFQEEAQKDADGTQEMSEKDTDGTKGSPQRNGSATEMQPEKEGVAPAPQPGAEAAGKGEPMKNGIPNERELEKSAAADEDRRVQGRRMPQGQGRTSRNKPERGAVTESEWTARQGNPVRNEEKTGNPGQQSRGAGTAQNQPYGSAGQQSRGAGTAQSQPYGSAGQQSRGAGTAQNQPYGSAGQQSRAAGAAQSQSRYGNSTQQTGNAGRQGSSPTGAAGQAGSFGNAGQQRNTAAAAGQTRPSGNAGQQSNAAAAAQPQFSGNTGQQAGSAGYGQSTTFGSTGQRTASSGTAASQTETIDLVEVFYLMWGNLWKIILCLIAGAAIAFSYTWYLVTPQYEATAKIYVVSSSSSSVINLSDLQLGTQLTADYEELILNHELLEDVIEALSLDMTYTDLKSMITITNPDDTRILRITVTSPDPAQARDIANELSRQAIVFLPDIMETAEPNIAEEAVLPTSPSSPSYTKNTLIGGMLGAIACMGILLVIYLMDDTVKSPDDLEKYFGTQPLSTVAECAMEEEKKKKKKSKAEDKSKTGVTRTSKSAQDSKSGTVPGALSGAAQEAVSQNRQDGAGEEGGNQWPDFGSRTLQVTKLPALPFDVTESLNQLRVNLSFCGSGIKSIMVTSSVPNEGKSFITINLWKMMARSGQKTLLIDADLRNSEMRSTYGITCDEKVKGIAYYLAGQAPLEQAIYSTNIPNGYMIPMASSVANPSILLESGRFVQMIEECSKEFDYILIDTPPIGSVADALNIATHCDGTVLVVHGGETPRKLVANSIQLLKRTGVPLLGLVLNRAEINNRAGGYYYRRYYRYGGYYYKKGYGHYGYGYGNADKKQQSKTKK